LSSLITAIQDGNQDQVEQAVLEFSQRRRIFAPLAMIVGAFVMLFDGVKLVLFNWRLTLVAVLPAAWIWLAMLDLKIHVLKGRSFHTVTGFWLSVIALAIVAITVVVFFLNAVFAFAVAEKGKPAIGPAFYQAREHWARIVTWGGLIGIWLAVSTALLPRYGKGWFVLSTSLVVGVMMYAYIALPARIIGIRPAGSTRDRVSASAVTGTLTAVVCSPAYLFGRIGVLMLGSKTLFIVGVVFVTIGIAVHTGASGAIKAITMSAKLAVGGAHRDEHPGAS
jgi:hypothetical protein